MTIGNGCWTGSRKPSLKNSIYIFLSISTMPPGNTTCFFLPNNSQSYSQGWISYGLMAFPYNTNRPMGILFRRASKSIMPCSLTELIFDMKRLLQGSIVIQLPLSKLVCHRHMTLLAFCDICTAGTGTVDNHPSCTTSFVCNDGAENMNEVYWLIEAEWRIYASVD